MHIHNNFTTKMIPDYILDTYNIPVTSLEIEYLNNLIQPWTYSYGYDRSKEAFLLFFGDKDLQNLITTSNIIPNTDILRGILEVSDINTSDLSIFDMINILQARIIFESIKRFGN